MEHENFVTHEQADKLKEVGFDWKCSHYYEGNGDCPWLCESTHFSKDTYVSDFYHNFNAYDRNSHRQPNYPRCSAPNISQIHKWLRETKGIHILPLYQYVKKLWYYEIRQLPEWDLMSDNAYYNSYEEALSNGIDRALEILKDKNNGK